MPPPPELQLAVDALALLPGAGLVAVREEGFVVVALREGRAGRAEGTDAERVVKTAWLRAGQPRAWPVPELPPATVGEVDRGGPIREAVATTWGTRTFESREPTGTSHYVKSGRVRLEDGRVLGSEAVAGLLGALAPVYGVELALGEAPPETSPAVTLIDDHAGTHSFDADGVTRSTVLVVDRGHFVHGVREGHATRPLTLSPMADHLRLVGEDDVGDPTVHALGPLRSTDARTLISQVVACSAA